MRIAIFGCGSIGERHARNLAPIGRHEIVLYDSDASRAAAVAQECGGRVADSVDQALGGAGLVLVCTPPHNHVVLAREAVEAGAHVFIEKPLSHTIDSIAALLDRAEEKQRSIVVGYNLRFHAGLRRVKQIIDNGDIGRPLIVRAEFGQYLPDWRPSRDYREGYNVHATMGGGVILDVSHEIDYVRWLTGEVSSVYCAGGHLSSLALDVEDTAAITLKIEGGTIGEVHLDSIQRTYSRQCKVIGERGTVAWDYTDGVRTYRADTGAWTHEHIVPEPNSMYVEEMKHLLAVVRGEIEPEVNGREGLRVLQVVLAARESLKTGCEVGL